ncbi:MAG TPA: hypothetical protein VG943_14140 [Caulobacterales bacterium]|nr:hypothetical protein [Caulobacterales bacterium]
MTYRFHRRRGVQGCVGAAMLLLAAAFVVIGWIFPIRPIGVLAILFGLGVGSLALLLILDIFTPGPILTIGPEGVCFLPFSPATVPWADITSVTVTHGYYYGSQGTTGPDGKSGVSYAVRDPSAFPKRGGISAVARATMSGNTISLNTLTLIDASGADILAAIREHYEGAITNVPIPGSASKP